MEFGVVLQAAPPAAKVVEYARQAELNGFGYAWTFDSHVLWQEPYVIYSQILAQTRKIKVGPMVTNPSTRDWTVTASVFASLTATWLSARFKSVRKLTLFGRLVSASKCAKCSIWASALRRSVISSCVAIDPPLGIG